MPEPLARSARERLDAGRLAAWASAWLAGAVSYDDAVAAVIRDRVHHVSGLPEHPDQVPLGWALSELRSTGATAVRLVLPVPGDLVGLPGPEALRRAALEVGAAAVATASPDVAGLGLVPRREEHGNETEGRTVTVAWTAVPSDPLPGSTYLPLREADQELTEALRRAPRRCSASTSRAGGRSWRRHWPTCAAPRGPARTKAPGCRPATRPRAAAAVPRSPARSGGRARHRRRPGRVGDGR